MATDDRVTQDAMASADMILVLLARDISALAPEGLLQFEMYPPFSLIIPQWASSTGLTTVSKFMNV